MFKKLFTFVLAFSIFSVSAMANTNDGLKAAFDEFNYSMTVEWDQKDQAFLEAKKLELTQTLEGFQAEGMTQKELITFTKSQLKDAALIKSLDSVLEAVALNKMTTEQAQEIMIRAIEKGQTRGASWEGAIIITPVGLLVLILVILVIAD